MNESDPPFGQVLGSPTAGGFRWFKGGVVGLAGHLTYEKEGLFECTRGVEALLHALIQLLKTMQKGLFGVGPHGRG